MLLNVFGNLLGGIIRIAVVAATMALVYFFAIKPILNTTEKITGGTNDSIQKAFDSVNQAFNQSDAKKIQKQIRVASKGTKTGPDVDKMINCVSKAGTNQAQIQRCVNRFTP